MNRVYNDYDCNPNFSLCTYSGYLTYHKYISRYITIDYNHHCINTAWSGGKSSLGKDFIFKKVENVDICSSNRAGLTIATESVVYYGGYLHTELFYLM